MRPAPPLRFRPHHFLCALGYQGKGYSDAFTANMSAIVIGRLRAPGGGAEVIEVTAGADAICGPCPSRQGLGCGREDRIARLDAAHAAALDLATGDRIGWGAAQARIRAHVPPGSLARLCAGCPWLELGMCEAALAALHAEGADQTAA